MKNSIILKHKKTGQLFTFIRKKGKYSYVRECYSNGKPKMYPDNIMIGATIEKCHHINPENLIQS